MEWPCRPTFIQIQAKDMEEQKIEQPQIQLQMLLDSVLSEQPTEFDFRGKRHKIGWLKKGAVRKFTHIALTDTNEQRRNVKICVVLLLNNFWKIKFLYWLYWRWLYYICDLDEVEILRVVDACKKKIPSTASSLLTILSTGMTDVMMTMTRKEVKATQAAPAGEPPTA